MKTIASRNKNVENWALTGYISPEKSIGDRLTNEELTDLTLKALWKVGVTDQNQFTAWICIFYQTKSTFTLL